MSADHERLDKLLERVLRSDGTIDEDAYGRFRKGLLTHIGIEERILFPEVRARGGNLEVQEQLHADHAVLAALLVPPPTAWEIERIKAILREHNPLEEGAGGFYESAERLMGEDLTAIVERARTVPEVPVAPYSDTPHLRRSIEVLLKKAGR